MVSVSLILHNYVAEDVACKCLLFLLLRFSLVTLFLVRFPILHQCCITDEMQSNRLLQCVDVPKPRSRATSLYSVQYSSTRGRSSPLDDELELNVNQLNTLASQDPNRPMTPRRVKRRSVSRGSGRHSRSSQRTSRQPTTSTTTTNGLINEGYSGTITASQSGTLTSVSSQQRGRESLRKKRYVNPVSRMMDESSTSNDSMPALPAYFPSSHPNGGYSAPPPPVNRDRLHMLNHRAPPTSRPPAVLPPPGHSNPLYQSSRPNSVYSISADVDYRPPSAHSSYSNWHGQRAMPMPANGHASSNHLHGHSPCNSPTPSTATTACNTNSFGVPSGQVASGYSSRSTHYSNYPSSNGQGMHLLHSALVGSLNIFLYMFCFLIGHY